MIAIEATRCSFDGFCQVDLLRLRSVDKQRRFPTIRRVRTSHADAPNGGGGVPGDQGTAPYDYAEHIGARLSVSSLYEDQLARRLGRCSR